MGDAPAKADVLQALLDAQQLCLDLFDEVEVNGLDIDRPRLVQMGQLVMWLDECRRAMVMRYALSDRAHNDFLDSVRKSLARTPDDAARPGVGGTEGDTRG